MVSLLVGKTVYKKVGLMDYRMAVLSVVNLVLYLACFLVDEKVLTMGDSMVSRMVVLLVVN